MSEHVTVAGFGCRDLTRDEQAKIESIGETIARRFATAGYAVHSCRPQGEGSYRLLLFIGSDGRAVGAIPSAELLAVPDERAAEVVRSWVVLT